MEEIKEGQEIGEVCNRDGCKGILSEMYREGGCTCFINAPCSYCCCNPVECDECGWKAEQP